MVDFIFKNKISILCLLIGVIAGFISYQLKKPQFKHRIAYQYPYKQLDHLRPELLNDTFFVINKVYIRNFTSSSADTLKHLGIKASEFKIFHPRKLNATEIQKILTKLSEDQAKIYDFKSHGSIKYSSDIMLYPALGLYLALLIHSLSRWRKTQ